MPNTPTVSIIIPVYNAAKELPYCLEALGNQTYRKLELCFVNDCSDDNSEELIGTFAQQQADIVVKIETHTHNRGVAAARNTGLNMATGKYIYYVDADDTIAPEAITHLVTMAEEKDLDIVGHDWVLEFEQNGRYMRQRDYTTPEEAIRNMMCGVMRWNLWLFLVKRSLYTNHNICFTEEMNMGEDMMVMIKLFICAHQVGITHQPLYHYKQCNEQSLTKVYSEEHIRQVTANVSEVENYIKASNKKDTLLPFIDYLKLNIKLPLLFTDNEERYRQWTTWFPEANKAIWNNKLLPMRTRLVQWMGSKQYWTLVKGYYRFIYKFIYGVIFK